MRSVTTPGIDPSYTANGIAVDSAGTIYVSGGAGSDTRIFEFSAAASGSVAPSNTVTLKYNGSLSAIAVD